MLIWLRRLWQGQPDTLIDDLIKANRAVEREGMRKVDWRLMNRLGRRRWTEVAQAQGRRAGQRIDFTKRVNDERP